MTIGITAKSPNSKSETPPATETNPAG